MICTQLLATGAEVTVYPDYAQGRVCLDNSASAQAKDSIIDWPTRALFLSVVKPISVQVSNWSSAIVASNLAAIFMGEVLGYTVELQMNSGNLTYHYLGASGEQGADVNFELWPALAYKAAEKQVALARYCGTNGRQGPCVRIGGALGYQARSGWFVPWKALPPELSFNASTVRPHAYATNGAGRLPRSIWMDIDFLGTPLARDQFLHAWEVTPINVCDLKADNEAVGEALNLGTYNCSAGTWTPKNVRCCPREGKPGGCAPGDEPCLALILSNPNYDVNQNEKMLYQSGLPAQLVYTDVAATTAQSIASVRPVLLYHWEPDYFMAQFEFVRVRLEEHLYCENGANSTELRLLGVHACDYPFVTVEKGYSERLLLYSDVFSFIDRFQIQYLDMMEMLSDLQANGDPWQSACTWLRANQEAKEAAWHVPRTANQPMLLTIVCLVLAVLWLFASEITAALLRLRANLRRVYRLTKVQVEGALDLPDYSSRQESFMIEDRLVKARVGAVSGEISIVGATMVVSEMAGEVIVPIVRFGSAESAVTITVKTVEWTGEFNASFGRITAVGADGARIDGLKGSDGRSVQITMSPGVRSAAVAVQIIYRPWFNSDK